jgi:predicted pyridoxine 5'-phosphate oxidase superfamily flavin-nucleotide-binding protein
VTLARGGGTVGRVAPRTSPLVQARSTVQRTVDGPAPDVNCESLPGSLGEHALQCAYGTEARARRFYSEQVRDRLLPAMMAFVQRMDMVFVASADARGECDASLRAGPPGFVRVLDARTLAYPEYRGNGVHASLGNIVENAHIGLLMVDFVQDLIGLHVNGTARIVEGADFAAAFPQVVPQQDRGRPAQRWVVVDIEEAYVHCRKHIPRMARVHERREWGTDDPGRKGGDYFGAKQTPRWRPRPYAPRRRFPSTTHLGGGSARILRGRT